MAILHVHKFSLSLIQTPKWVMYQVMELLEAGPAVVGVPM